MKESRWFTDPVFREKKYLSAKIAQRRSGGAGIRPRISLEELEARYADAKKGILWAAQQKWRPLPKSAPKPKPLVIAKAAAESRARNLATWKAQMELGRLRKQSKEEWKEMVEAWKAKWLPIVGVRSSKKARAKKHRNHWMRLSQVKNDKAMGIQVQIINSGPCSCYWCNTPLPNGGEVDHIKPLAKGGTHSSDNIAAACKACNSTKQDKSPAEAGFNDTLF